MMFEIGIYNMHGTHIDTVHLPAAPSIGDDLIVNSMIFKVKKLTWSPQRVPILNVFVE